MNGLNISGFYLDSPDPGILSKDMTQNKESIVIFPLRLYQKRAWHAQLNIGLTSRPIILPHSWSRHIRGATHRAVGIDPFGYGCYFFGRKARIPDEMILQSARMERRRLMLQDRFAMCRSPRPYVTVSFQRH